MGRSVRSKRAQHNRQLLREKVYSKIADNHIKAAAERLEKYLAEAKANEPMIDAPMTEESGPNEDVEMQPKEKALSLKRKIEKKKKAKKHFILGRKVTKKNKKQVLKTRF